MRVREVEMLTVRQTETDFTGYRAPYGAKKEHLPFFKEQKEHKERNLSPDYIIKLILRLKQITLT